MKTIGVLLLAALAAGISGWRRRDRPEGRGQRR